MSHLRQGNDDDYPEAAVKHMQDSGVLLAGGRYDGAAYLAGYVVECALKSIEDVDSAGSGSGEPPSRLVETGPGP